MNSLAQTLTQSNPIQAIATAYAETGARFVTIHKNDSGKVVLYRSQRDQLVIQHFPRTVPGMTTGTLVLENYDGRQADETSVRTWLAETADLMGEPAPALASSDAPAIEATPTCPLEQAAADLTAEYSDHPRKADVAKRIASGLELAQAGLTRFPHYHTEKLDQTFHGCWRCDCADARFRSVNAKIGTICKHTMAGEIARRVEADAEAIAYRHHIDKIEAMGRRRNLPTIAPEQAEKIKRDIDRDAALGYETETRSVEEQKRAVRASLGHALRPDAINKSKAGAGRAQFGRGR